MKSHVVGRCTSNGYRIEIVIEVGDAMMVFRLLHCQTGSRCRNIAPQKEARLEALPIHQLITLAVDTVSSMNIT